MEIGIRSVSIRIATRCTSRVVKLTGVLQVPYFTCPLLSVHKLVPMRITLEFSKTRCNLRFNGDFFAIGFLEGSLLCCKKRLIDVMPSLVLPLLFIILFHFHLDLIRRGPWYHPLPPNLPFVDFAFRRIAELTCTRRPLRIWYATTCGRASKLHPPRHRGFHVNHENLARVRTLKLQPAQLLTPHVSYI